MNPPNLASQLSPKQREVLQSLVTGSTVTASAASAGLHRTTVHKWCRENTLFRAALRDAESQQASTAVDGMRAMLDSVLEKLTALLDDPATPAAVRLRAISLVLNTVMSSDPYSRPAEPRLSTADVDRIIEAGADVGAKEQALRQATAEPPPPAAGPSPVSAMPNGQVPRSAPCPCGSGEKFKRCCGRSAPGIFHNTCAA